MDPLSPKMNQASRATFVGDILEEVVGILRSARWKCGFPYLQKGTMMGDGGSTQGLKKEPISFYSHGFSVKS